MKFAGTIVVCATLALLLGSCRSGFVSPYKVRGLRVSEPIFEIRGMRLPDSSVRFSFVAEPRIRTADPTIRWVELSVRSSDIAAPDTLVMNTSDIVVEGSRHGKLLIGSVLWEGPSAAASASAQSEVSVLTSSDHLVYSQAISYQPATPLDMLPFSYRTSDSLLTVGVVAVRVFTPKGEYLPSSERVRLIISDQKGNVVWRSDAGMQYMTLVGQVEPTLEGRTEQYTSQWNGVDLQGNAVRPGTYECEIVIPARPTPYSVRTSVQWPPR